MEVTTKKLRKEKNQSYFSKGQTGCWGYKGMYLLFTLQTSIPSEFSRSCVCFTFIVVSKEEFPKCLHKKICCVTYKTVCATKFINTNYKYLFFMLLYYPFY